MFDFLKRIFEKKKPAPQFSQQQYDQHHQATRAALEKILGPMHDVVSHAVIPFQIGGAVDMYYFPNGLPGTGFATMELIAPDGSGPKPNRIGTYELLAFTKQTMPTPEDKSAKDHPFEKIERRMREILTTVGHYSYDAVLNPGETCEVPGQKEEPTKCLVFDEYDPDGVGFLVDGRRHCLLLCMEVFRSEMDDAMRNGSASLLEKLKSAGHYPYSDLDREPVA